MRIIQSKTPRPLDLLAVGPNGLVAAACSAFGAPGDVEIWNVASGARAAVCRNTRELFSLAFDATGEHLIFSAAGEGITFASARTGRALSWLETWCTDATFAVFPDGTRLLIAPILKRVSSLECWRVNSDPTFLQLWADPVLDVHSFGALAVSPDGSLAAVVERSEWNDGRPRLDISDRDTATGKRAMRIALDPSNPVKQLAFTADGSKLFVRTDDRKVQLYAAATGAATGELVHPGRSFVSGIAVHPRGPIACARNNGTVTFWDADRREQLRTLDWKAGKLVSVAFGPDGAIGAAGTEDGKVIVWDVDI